MVNNKDVLGNRRGKLNESVWMSGGRVEGEKRAMYLDDGHLSTNLDNWKRERGERERRMCESFQRNWDYL